MAISTSIKLKFDGAAVNKGLKGVEKGFGRINAAGGKLAGALISPFAKLAALLGPSAIAGGITAFGIAASKSASNLENLKAQIEIFTGSASKASEVIDKLRTLAVQSPLELSDISEGAKLLLSYGISADEVVDVTSRLSEVSAGNAEKFQRLSLAFGQAASIGRLMGTELRQFTESGFNPLEAIAAKTGETMLVLRKRMQDGGVTIDELKDSLRQATSEGGRFFGLNEKMSQTFSGRLSMMKDSWDRLLSSFGTGMNEGLKAAVNAINTNIPSMIGSFTSAGGYIGDAIADSVRGNNEKFAAIGGLIGSLVVAGMKASFQTAVYGGLFKVLEDYNPLRKIGPDSWKNGGKLSQSTLASFSDNLQSSMMSGGIREKAAAISQGNQGLVPNSGGQYRFAAPGEQSTFSDAYGNKIVQLLGRIDQKLAPTP